MSSPSHAEMHVFGPSFLWRRMDVAPSHHVASSQAQIPGGKQAGRQAGAAEQRTKSVTVRSRFPDAPLA